MMHVVIVITHVAPIRKRGTLRDEITNVRMILSTDQSHWVTTRCLRPGLGNLSTPDSNIASAFSTSSSFNRGFICSGLSWDLGEGGGVRDLNHVYTVDPTRIKRIEMTRLLWNKDKPSLLPKDLRKDPYALITSRKRKTPRKV